MKIKKKKITIDGLAEMIQATRGDIAGLTKKVVAGDLRTRSFVRKEIANLAGMAQRGFLSAGEQLKEIKAEIKNIKEEPIASHEKRIRRVEDLLVIKN